MLICTYLSLYNKLLNWKIAKNTVVARLQVFLSAPLCRLPAPLCLLPAPPTILCAPRRGFARVDLWSCVPRMIRTFSTGMAGKQGAWLQYADHFHLEVRFCPLFFLFIEFYGPYNNCCKHLNLFSISKYFFYLNWKKGLYADYICSQSLV